MAAPRTAISRLTGLRPDFVIATLHKIMHKKLISNFQIVRSNACDVGLPSCGGNAETEGNMNKAAARHECIAESLPILTAGLARVLRAGPDDGVLPGAITLAASALAILMLCS
jgi:hypothetical protein